MTIYVDTSVLVSLFAGDAHTSRAEGALRNSTDQIAVNALTGLEFTSAVNQFHTSHKVSRNQCEDILTDYSQWIAGNAISLELKNQTFFEASNILAQLRFNLRGPDALHIAICRAASATLLTFDVNMATAARALGVDVFDA